MKEVSGGRAVSAGTELLGMVVDSSATTAVWVVMVGGVECAEIGLLGELVGS